MLVAWAVAGCGGGTNADPCEAVTDVCQTDGEIRCTPSKNGVQACRPDPDVVGCLSWATTDACGEHQSCESVDQGCQCSSECSINGETRCQGEVVQSCTSDTDGCLYWQDGEDCATLDNYSCDDNTEPAVCLEGCTDKCTASETQCSGTMIQDCTLVGECYFWTDLDDCADSSQICSDSSGSAGCYAPCSDDCTTAGASQCDGDAVQNCVTQDDGCNDWVTMTDCGANSRICSAASGQAGCYDPCSDDCTTVDETQCDSDWVQTCTLGANGCSSWVNTTDCAADSLVCADYTGTPGCATPCTNDCDTLDETRCNDAATDIEICSVGLDGCNDWVANTNCSGDGKDCWDSKCVDPCTDECDTLDTTQCDAGNTIVQTCQFNNDDGCNDLVDSPCADPTPACDVVDGTAVCICLDECDTPGGTCNGNTPENCVSGQDGCNDFVVGTSCAPVACVVGGNTAACQTSCSQIVYQSLDADDPEGTWSQDFETAHDDLDSFAADDFTLGDGTTISTIWTRSRTLNTTYLSASAVHYAIYANSGGHPAGIPVYGAAPIWGVSLAPTDAQLTIVGNELVLNLNTSVTLSAGTYWLSMWVTMDSAGGQHIHGWYMSATTNGYDAMAYVRQNGSWLSLPDNGARHQDMAFGLSNCP